MINTSPQSPQIWAISGREVRRNCPHPMNITQATKYVKQYYIPSGGGGVYQNEGFYCQDNTIWNDFLKNCRIERIDSNKICRISSFNQPVIQKTTNCCIIM